MSLTKIPRQIRKFFKRKFAFVTTGFETRYEIIDRQQKRIADLERKIAELKQNGSR